MRLHDFLDFHARERPSAPFAVDSERAVTHRDARDEVNRLANALVAAGSERGARIGVLAKNRIEYVLAYLAASKAGVVVVPINTRLSPPQWHDIITDAGVQLLLVGDEYVAAVDALRPDLPGVTHVVAFDPTDRPGWIDYQAWLTEQPASAPARIVGADEVLYQMYTSGTTGFPKGALLTQRTVTAQMQQMGLDLHAEPGARWLLVAPLFHAGATNAIAFQSIFWGGCLVIQADFSPHAVVRALSDEAITVALLVPAMLQACLETVPDVAERRYPRLRTMLYGASPIAEPTLRRAIAVFGCDFVQAYGLTEMTAGITFLRAADHRRALADKPGLLLSAGRPYVGTEVQIVDAADVPVPNGVIGEIVARGPQVMRGYWRQDAATSEVLRGGWLHTGDAGTLDDQGYLYIQDRVKDVIVSGGENVYPRSVENVLFAHPAVADAAVIGVPDERWGETVKAIVVLRPGMTVLPDELIDFCRGHLAGFERPRSVDVVDALPRNPSGKVLKRELREPYWVGHERRVSGS
jgi:acyl-CoA synthetase (AMP-forming)/AMP-acid ligase II